MKTWDFTRKELMASLEAGGIPVERSWPVETEAALTKYGQWCPDHRLCEITETQHGASCTVCCRAFCKP